MFEKLNFIYPSRTRASPNNMILPVGGISFGKRDINIALRAVIMAIIGGFTRWIMVGPKTFRIKDYTSHKNCGQCLANWYNKPLLWDQEYHPIGLNVCYITGSTYGYKGDIHDGLYLNKNVSEFTIRDFTTGAVVSLATYILATMHTW